MGMAADWLWIPVFLIGGDGVLPCIAAGDVSACG